MKFLIKINCMAEFKYLGCDCESWIMDIFNEHKLIFKNYNIILGNDLTKNKEIIKNLNWFIFSNIVFENFSNENYTFCDVDENDIIINSCYYPIPVSAILDKNTIIKFKNTNMKNAKDLIINDMIYFENY